MFSYGALLAAEEGSVPVMAAKRRLVNHELIQRARELRRNMTEPERRLWYALRDRRLAGWKFRRQAVFGPFILDFYSHVASLALEIDGDSHIERAASDRARQDWLEAQGVKVVRVANDEILQDLEAVIEGIAKVLDMTNKPGPETE